MGYEALDSTARQRHRLRNLAHSALLLLGMVALLFAISWLLFGSELALWALVGWALALVWAPRISPQIVMRMYRARELTPAEFPTGYDALRTLAARAGLARSPRLYYIPSSTLNAFTLGSKDDAVISVTDGLIRTLTLRELAGVLAHEISHIRNKDLWVMSLADSISRLTSFFSFAGIVLLFLSVPMMLFHGSLAPLVVSFVLIVAPTFASLLQLALSRAREFDADLEAAGLTGDPVGLASALRKLEQHQAGLWERVFLPGRRIPDPSLFRSHPTTAERVERLLSLYPEDRRRSFGPSERPRSSPQAYARSRDVRAGATTGFGISGPRLHPTHCGTWRTGHGTAEVMCGRAARQCLSGLARRASLSGREGESPCGPDRRRTRQMG